MSISKSAPWKTLAELAQANQHAHMRDWFTQDPTRSETFNQSACGINVDFSKNTITNAIFDQLIALADTAGVQDARAAMFAGSRINYTEDRAVLHTALRNFGTTPVLVEGQDVLPQVQATRAKIKAFTAALHDGVHTGYTGKKITDVVSIGIGGSFLGPKIMTEALKPYHQHKLNVHFVANVDGCHIQDVLAERDPETTLVLMSSKSFGTQETKQNTLTAKAWFLGTGAPSEAVAQHFAAISSNVPAAVEFGMNPELVFPMDDWVGGRYSLWSAIGMPIALAVGYANFEALLKGAYAMDRHFQEAPLGENLPVILGMLGVWYRNFQDAQSHVLLPYYHYLRGFPAYVQQLDMESNGKRNVADGSAVDYATGPIIFGSEGTNGQHSFHQLIHQGDTIIPADFILPLNVPKQDDTHHAMLASNCFGQTQALMQGKTFAECRAELPDALTDAEKDTLAAHKVMPGNKPSNTITFDQLDPFTLGAMVALYEHKVFVQGVVWGVNSFDQWGVELGKVLGNQVLDAIHSGEMHASMDSSTQALINQFRAALKQD
ncbi:MAG: glucose-6-phosphate isomerase [Glaciecola sp.]|jgi:glucose-6-phosphate isomerase|nr:glucose-6-phosphate isomerase [Glaciecola sp.]MDG1815832.1 glucose-6-phosphate isomerase [Glaciecola sp.]MDG2100080.1 glucose-6-phosphate isomerase [Glaciecola sp.]